MADEWNCGLPTDSSARGHLSSFECHLAEIPSDMEELEADDFLEMKYTCPFCGEDFDLVVLSCHIDEDHPLEAKSEVCPACKSEERMDLIRHIMTKHGNTFMSKQEPKFRKDVASDPLLSFICNVATIDDTGGTQPGSSFEVCLNERRSDEEMLDRNIQLPALSNRDQEEKVHRCEFARTLLLSALFDDIP